MNSHQVNHISFEPIKDMQFEGLHWIEASAGTGKTYTLSSLMVRILLGKYLPHQVIATTFTRAAAAELKTRIRLRLIETLKFFDDLQNKTSAEIQIILQQEKDPLFQKVLQDYLNKVDYAKERLKLVLDQLDELFVGTLDSFSQKILREFSFESGKIELAEITDDAKSYTYQLIHDVLREWIQAQPQNVINYLLLQQKLKSVDQYIAIVENTLNFTSAHFQEVVAPSVQTQQFENNLIDISQITNDKISELAEYYSENGQYFTHINKKAFSKNKFTQIFEVGLPNLINNIKKYGIQVYFSSNLDKSIQAVESIFFDSKGNPRESVFKKCDQTIIDDFYNHDVIQKLKLLLDSSMTLNTSLDLLDSYLKFHLSKEVKKRLPQVLQQKGETTFAQQIRTLAEALQGMQGQRFAQFIQAKYPLILVDEFQDTNQDQDDMLARIWRDAQRYTAGCMIMVGDPKQAIYGFRGGDMLTYNKARIDVLAKHGHQYSLRFNHRSTAHLVEVVDALFQRQMDFGEDVFYQPVEAGRQHAPLMDQHGENHLPLRWITLDDKADEPIQVAWKIRELLNQSNLGQLFLNNNGIQQKIIEDDIAILSKNHDGLDKAQYELERLGIRVNRPSKKSVLDSQIAKDVGALLTAIMHPYDEGKVKRALLTRLLNFKLKDLIELEQRAEGLSQFIADFDLIREMWLDKGFLTAWQFALNLFHVWENMVANQSRDNERAVVNLRHLTEVLSQHSEQYQGAQNLYHWYLKQLESPSEREWELERKLSNEAGVQLMTIHQSKGLEYKIVFLLGADKSFKEMGKTLNFSTETVINPATKQEEQYRVIAINDKALITDEAQKQHQQRAEAEQHRLWYVALTRASYRVYAMMSDLEGKSTTGLAFWRGQGEQVFQHPLSANEEPLKERPNAIKEQQIQLSALHAMTFPEQRFYPRSKTSFSALSQHLSRKQAIDALAAQIEHIESAEDETHIVVEQEEESEKPIDWIKHQFPMGTLAGNFLHEIFEHIDFQDMTFWSLEIYRRFKNDYPVLWAELLSKFNQDFPELQENQLIELMMKWLEDVLETPLYHNFQLKKLEKGQHLAEFPFYLSLADHVLSTKRIHQLFADYGIYMLDLNEANSARYLTGSIDLVFFDGQRYQIADYKSNFLGTDQSHYSTEKIKENMSQSSYWLQAGLYLVALHRYLKVQLDDYDIYQHLGGATYLYLRGMNGQMLQGYQYWEPEPEFILRLDALLGTYTENKIVDIV